MVVTVPPQGALELWGRVSSKVGPGARVTPRSQEWLPPGLSVEEAELVNSEEAEQVKVRVVNRGKRGVVINASHILAEMHGVEASPAGPKLEAVVGPSCETKIKVEGKVVRGLIDSGSQVTVVAESFYDEHLRHLVLSQLETPLDIIGAGGQTVPYLGVVNLKVSVPKEVGGNPEEVTTYAVVCPDSRLSQRTPVIIGTNTLRRLSGSAVHPFRCEVAFAYKEAETALSGLLGVVRLPGRGLTLRPHEAVVVKGRSRKCRSNREEVLVQEPVQAALPEGVQVLSSKVLTASLPRVKVTLVNRTDQPISIKGGRVIAELYSFQEQYAISNVIQQLQARDQQTTNTVPLTPNSSTDPESLVARLRFGEGVDPVWKESFLAKILTYADCFNTTDFQNLGRTDVQHDIVLTPGPAIRERPRPVPPQDREELRQHLQQLLEANIIRPSTSPFASPIVLVRKKNGALRMCCDYRRINNRTVRDSYALPKIEDLFMTLGRSKFFTGLDLSKAYYQVPLTERAKKVSAFTTPFGLYEFERLSFGMVNAPMTFQRLMEQCFGDMNLVDLIIFLDDLLIHADTLDELGQKTIKVLDRLRHFNLKLDPDKCVFGAKEVSHLGFLISGDGLRPDPRKLEALTSWKVPTTVREVKSFIGFAGYYRRHVAKFSQITIAGDHRRVHPEGLSKEGR